MSGIIVRIPRTRQPQGAVQASSWARSRGIGSLLLPSVGLRDIVDGGTWTSWGTAPTISAGSHGICIDSTAAFGGLMLLPRVNQATAAQTHILLVETTATSAAYAGLVASASSDGSSTSIAVQRDFSNSEWATWTGNVSSSIWTSPKSQAIGPSLLVIVGDASGAATYLDGALINSAGTAITPQSNSRLVLHGARDASAAYATKARTYLYAHLTQRLTAGEIAALSANPWQLFAPTTRRIWVPGAGGGGDVSAALTGSAAAVSAGTLTPSLSVATIGTAVTASAGTIAPAASIAISGSAVTSSVGTLAPSAAKAISGSEVASSAGTLAPSVTIGLSGSEVGASAGTLAQSNAIGLTGVAVASSAGTLVPSITNGLTGESVTASSGNVTYSAGSDLSLSISGQHATAEAGTVSPAITIGLTGEAVTASAGTITYSSANDVVIELTGSAVAVQTGYVAYASSLGLYGEAASALAGTITTTGGQTAGYGYAISGRNRAARQVEEDDELMAAVVEFFVASRNMHERF